MNCIIKLHGTSGSGKTTVARELMKNADLVRTILNPASRKPEAYEVRWLYKNPLFILGPYTATCGGLDSLSDVNDHIRLLHQCAEYGHVFYEGLLGSEYYGRIGKETEKYGDSHIFAFLDTPIDLCLARVQARRLARGNTKPLNPANTVGRVAKIERLRYRLENEFKRPTRTITHLSPTAEILNIYREYDAL